MKAGAFRAADSRGGPTAGGESQAPRPVHGGEMRKPALNIHFLDFSECQARVTDDGYRLRFVCVTSKPLSEVLPKLYFSSRYDSSGERNSVSEG